METSALNHDAAAFAGTVDLGSLFNAQRFAELENNACLLLTVEANSGIAWKMLGAALYMQGKDPLTAMQTAARLLPNDAEAHNNLGCAFQEAGHHEKALAMYRQATGIRPDFFEAHVNLAAALADMGQLDAAATSYRRALTINPCLAEAHCRLGEVLRRAGHLTDALESFRTAIACEPNLAEAHMKLGSTLRQLGHLAEAAAAYRQTIVLQPDFAEAHSNLGIVLRDLGQLNEAVASYGRALKIKPDAADTHNNLGVALRDLGHFEQAVASCRRAIDIKPDLYEARSNLGNVLQDLGQFEDAVCSYRRAIEIHPDFAAAHSNLGAALRKLGKLREAITSCQRAIELQPEFAEAHNNLGVSLKTQGELDLALASFLAAAAHDKNAADAYCNIGVTLQEQGKPAECLQYFTDSLAAAPNRAATRYAFGLMHLQNGNLQEGWAGYEYRWSGSDAPIKKMEFAQPAWQGEALEGKTILIWNEQGIGDEIMFAGLLGELVMRAKRCIVACTPKLLPLFSESFAGAEFIPLADVHSPGLLNEIDYQCPSGSLARWMRADVASFYGPRAYLKPTKERVLYWKNRLANMGPGLKVGICWRSANLSGSRHLHYSALEQWGPIFAVQGVHFINLQYDKCDLELEAARNRFRVPIHAFSEVDLYNDMREAAALTAAMDLVIGPTTASGRLAAALGVPTWALRYGTADWTSLGTDHSPWLPCVRFFSRTWDQGWKEVIKDVADHLTVRVDESTR